jgi:hypothetical protein
MYLGITDSILWCGLDFYIRFLISRLIDIDLFEHSKCIRVNSILNEEDENVFIDLHN